MDELDAEWTRGEFVGRDSPPFFRTSLSQDISAFVNYVKGLGTASVDYPEKFFVTREASVFGYVTEIRAFSDCEGGTLVIYFLLASSEGS
jgi:hypothetical protein